MNVTIIRNDNVVIIDGVGMPVDCTALPGTLRAVHWDSVAGSGEEEHTKNGLPTNEPITDFSAYQVIVDKWTAAKADADAAKAKAEADRQAYLASVGYLRALRDAKLMALDWLVTRHQSQEMAGVPTTLTAAQATELGLYQQALRDITKTCSNAQTVVWPQAPAWLEA